MASTRIEKDSMGELEVPSHALYGAQTQRAVNNFPISGRKMPKAFIEALIKAKAAAASANGELDHNAAGTGQNDQIHCSSGSARRSRGMSRRSIRPARTRIPQTLAEVEENK